MEDRIRLIMTMYKVEICGFLHDFGRREFDELRRVS